MQQHGRPLTYDEKKAAEAAFHGLPSDPKWSQAAHKVYAGISLAMGNKRNEAFAKGVSSPTTTMPKQALPESLQMSRVICGE